MHDAQPSPHQAQSSAAGRAAWLPTLLIATLVGLVGWHGRLAVQPGGALDAPAQPLPAAQAPGTVASAQPEAAAQSVAVGAPPPAAALAGLPAPEGGWQSEDDPEAIVAAAIEDARLRHPQPGAAQTHAPRPGGGQAAKPAEPGRRGPLRHHVGRYVALWTDCRPEYAKELLGQLDSFVRQAHDQLAQILGLQVQPKPVQIYVFEAQEQYQAYAREHAPALVGNGGYYDGALRTVVTYRYNNSVQLYFHELVHAILGEQFGDHQFSRYTRRHWPVWFDEGMAEYLGSFRLQDGQLVIPAVNRGKLAYLANALHNDALLDLQTLLRAPPERFSGASMNFYYASAWGLVDLLLSSPKWRAEVPRFFARIKAGEDGIAAFRACFGSSDRAIEAAWRARIAELSAVQPGQVHLFDGKHVWDWTVHEGGNWRAQHGEITGHGDNAYNYLIKADVPLSALTLQVDVQLARGTAGLILGNHDHREYPYHYLIDISKDAVLLRRAWSATRIEPVIQAWADVPLGKWIRVSVDVQDGVLRVALDGREVLSTRADRPRLSMFGLFLYKANVKFRNVTLTRRVADDAQPLSLPAGSANLPAPGTR